MAEHRGTIEACFLSSNFLEIFIRNAYQQLKHYYIARYAQLKKQDLKDSYLRPMQLWLQLISLKQRKFQVVKQTEMLDTLSLVVSRDFCHRYLEALQWLSLERTKRHIAYQKQDNNHPDIVAPKNIIEQ